MPHRAMRPAFLLLVTTLLVLGAHALAPVPAAAGLLAGAPPALHVDLNRDPPERLALIPGIGPRRAHAIVAFRSTHGPFARARDLLRVPGVGPGLMRRLAPLLDRSSPDRPAPTPTALDR